MQNGISAYFIANYKLQVLLRRELADLLYVRKVSEILKNKQITDLMDVYPVISPLMLANALYAVRDEIEDLKEEDNFIEVDV